MVFSNNWPCQHELCLRKTTGPHCLVRHPSGQLLDIDGLHDGMNVDGPKVVDIIAAPLWWQRRKSDPWETLNNLTRAQVTADALSVVASVMV